MDFQQDFSEFKVSLKERIYDYLRSQIIIGKLPPGTKLPEVELSKSMNISRAPIREALNLLFHDGFVTIIPRKGAMVSEITPDKVVENWEIRLLIEPYAAKIAAALIPSESIAKLHNQLDEVLENCDDFDNYMKSDLALHELIHSYVPNRYLHDFLVTTMAHSMRIRYYSEQDHHTRKNIIESVTKDHLAIIEAMKSGDPESLYSAMQKHIINGRERSLDVFLKRHNINDMAN